MSSIPKVKKSCSFDPVVFNAVNPITSVKVYNNGVMVVTRESKLQGKMPEGLKGRKDKEIKMLTSKSLARLIATIQATDVKFTTMLTLTYPEVYPKSGKVVKSELNTVLQFLRDNGMTDYLWFLEFQARGAPHIHILTSHSAITPRMRINLAECWIRIISNSHWFFVATDLQAVQCDKCQYKVAAKHLYKAYAVVLHADTWQWIREKDGAKRYVTKYAAKQFQKIVPKPFLNVGRFWGSSRTIVLKGGHKVDTTTEQLKQFLDDQNHPTANWEVIPKYLFNVQNIS